MAEGRGAPRRLRLALGVALAAPLVITPLAARALADHLAERGATQLSTLAARLDALRPANRPLPPPLPPPPVAEEAQADALGAPDEALAASRARSGAPVKKARRAADRGAIPRGLRIRAAAVLRAARSGARPGGAPVPARGPRPAGLALHGVGQFGVGLRDGDVLTQIAGAPARSVDTVIAAVAGALRARAPIISAVVWRGEQPIQVAVELPRSRT